MKIFSEEKYYKIFTAVSLSESPIILSSQGLCKFVGVMQTEDVNIETIPSFKSDESITKIINDVVADDNLSVYDYRMSKALHIALDGLTPSLSVDWRFWASLSFGQCLDYMLVRWNVRAPITNETVKYKIARNGEIILPEITFSKLKEEIISGVIALTDDFYILNVSDKWEKVSTIDWSSASNTTILNLDLDLNEDAEIDDSKNATSKKSPLNRARGILLQRWLGGSGGLTSLTRHGVARLWWIAKIASMAAAENPRSEKLTSDHYLKILFSNQNIQWSIVLRRYGAMPVLVKALLDFIFSEYLEDTTDQTLPYKLKEPSSVVEIKNLTKLVNTAVGGSLYDLKSYDDMYADIGKYRALLK